MAELQDKISRLFPDATFEEGEILMIHTDDSNLHQLIATLRDQLGFDYLVTIVGNDWKTSLGCVYYLRRPQPRSS